MIVKPGYDSEKNRIMLSIETNLLSRYYKNFSGMVMKTLGIPEGTEVRQLNETTALITFPLDETVDDKPIRISPNQMAIGISREKHDLFEKIIKTFIKCALRKELRTTEFIPLYGYPKENLKLDVQEAVKNNRKLCIIQNYDEYLSMKNNHEDYIFHQIMLEPGTHDYAEASVLLYNEDLETLRKLFEPRLKLENWF